MKLIIIAIGLLTAITLYAKADDPNSILNRLSVLEAKVLRLEKRLADLETKTR